MSSDVVVRTTEEAEFPQGKLPALKVPDAAFLLDRLKAGESAGLLSRQKRAARVGQRQFLVNELKPTGADAASVWAVVLQRAPQRFRDLAALPAELHEGIDRFTREEFAGVEQLYYLPLELVTAFDTPVRLDTPPAGRRFASELELPTETSDVATNVAAKRLNLAPDPEGGVHSHALRRENAATANDGAHLHLFALPDGTQIMTREDGAHEHQLRDSQSTADWTEQDGVHSHALSLPDGTELTTNKVGEHNHQLQVAVSGFDGIHQHVLELPNGQTIATLLPGEFWERTGKPAQTETPPAPQASELAKKKSELLEIDKEAIPDLGRAQSLARAFAEAAPAFAERQLRFIIGPPDVISFLRGLPDKAQELADLLDTATLKQEASELPVGVVAIADELSGILSNIEGKIGQAFEQQVTAAQQWLDRFVEIAGDLARAEDDQEIDKQDLTTADLEDGGARIPAQGQGLVQPLKIKRIDPIQLRRLGDAALLQTDKNAHTFFSRWFAGSDRTSYRGTSREDVINAELFLVAEFNRRELKHERDDELATEARKLERLGKDDGELAPVNASGDEFGDAIHTAEVLDHLKSFKLRMPVAYLVGGLANRGSTQGDIDILIKGPMSDEMRRTIEFRLGRMLPPELSQRVQFLTDELGGPITSHVEIADLVVQMRPRFELKRMRLAKQDDPLLDLPPVDSGPLPAILQYHFRGKSLHADLRMQANDHIVGWTLAVQQPSVITEAVNTEAKARSIMRSFSLEGDDFIKPLLAPAKVFATPKARQPLVWLEIDGEVFPAGEVGATRNEAGVMVAADKPRVEFGIQTPSFHEYFFTRGKVLTGVMNFRALVGEDGAPQEEADAGRRTKPGEVFWTAFVSKSALPSVLDRRAVRVKRMPLDGYSAIPRTLEQVTPKEFRYWETSGEEARQIRDALVESKFFTDKNVRIVDGEFRRVVRKLFLYHSDSEDAPEPFAARFREYLAKQPHETRFALSWQFWKGQTVVRAAPSRQVWHLMLDDRNGGLTSWVLQQNPLAEDRIGAVLTPRPEKDLLEFDGDVEPQGKVGGEVLNDTKATPSTIRVIDGGTATILDDQPTFKKLRFEGKNLRGEYTIVAEEEGSRQWQLSRGTDPERVIPDHDNKVESEKSIEFVAKRLPTAKSAVAILEFLEPVNAVSGVALTDVRRRLGEDSEQRLAIGIVLEPETIDAQNDIYSGVEVRRAAEAYSREKERLKLMHEGAAINDRATILGSFIARESFEFGDEAVAKGSWLCAIIIPDDKLWSALKSGELGGFSIGGSAIRRPA